MSNNNASSKIVKIAIICISIVFGIMLVVSAGNIKVNTVTIKFANQSELNVLTSKTNVAEILEENHIILLDDEKVIPDLDLDITESKTISIVKVLEEEVEVSNENLDEMLNDILDNYGIITEKIVVEQEEIPFETITKDISNGDSNTQNRVLQNGKNGLKEITYKVTYQDDVEIKRVQLSESIVKEPVDKIVQISTVQISSRSSEIRVAVTGNAAEYQEYAKQRCYDYGWTDSDFNCLVALWNRESGWRVNAQNGSSGAYGIPQALPASKLSAYGSDYLTNYKTQIEWGLNYIRARYGTPTQAWYNLQNKGWY